MKRNPFITTLLLALIMLMMMALCSLVGVVHFSCNDILSGRIFENPIYMNLRLPRVILSILAGAALSVSGATYQSVFKNPLTDPYVLGISSGASLGAAISIILGMEHLRWGVGGMALLAGLGTMLLVYRIASLGNRLHTSTLLLTGVCFTFLSSAVISFLMVLHKDKMESIIFWTMGSFSSSSWSDVMMVLPAVLIGILVVIYHSKDLNLLLAGSETAMSLGVEVEKVKKRLLFFTTLMVAFAVSACGVIGFVGLIVPHAIRVVVGADNRKVIPYSIFVGGSFLLLCDTFSRVVLQPSELPVGSITAIIGAPVFIYLLYRNKKKIQA